MIYDMFVFYDFEIFSNSKNGLNSDYFAKIVHEISKPKYFPNILNDSDSPIYSLSDLIYIICWGNLSLSKIIGGGRHPTGHILLLCKTV